MKSIQTASAIEEQQRKRKKLGGTIIIGLLLLSTVGFAISGTGIGKPKEQEGLQYDGQYWTYFISGNPIYRFNYAIKELDFTNISLSKTLVDFGGKNLFIDSSDINSLQEIALNLGRHALKLSEACYGSCSRDIPEMTCDVDGVFIVVKESETPSIIEENNCVFINGNLKQIDAFLYRVLGLN
jgi:hypothetical protein